MALDASSITKIQKLSWMGGQLYVRTRVAALLRTYSELLSEVDVTIVLRSGRYYLKRFKMDGN